MRKSFPANPWFYPLPVLIIGTYGEDGNLIGQIVDIAFSDGAKLK